jgi:hypothetical protein
MESAFSTCFKWRTKTLRRTQEVIKIRVKMIRKMEKMILLKDNKKTGSKLDFSSQKINKFLSRIHLLNYI